MSSHLGLDLSTNTLGEVLVGRKRDLRLTGPGPDASPPTRADGPGPSALNRVTATLPLYRTKVSPTSASAGNCDLATPRCLQPASNQRLQWRDDHVLALVTD